MLQHNTIAILLSNFCIASQILEMVYEIFLTPLLRNGCFSGISPIAPQQGRRGVMRQKIAVPTFLLPHYISHFLNSFKTVEA